MSKSQRALLRAALATYLSALAASALILAIGGVAGQANAELIFRDDFEYEGEPDPNKWVVNHPECLWPACTQWVQGRTRFPNPDPWVPNLFPTVKNGACVIQHHLYDPFDQAPVNTTFLGGEIHTVLAFEPNRAYRFEAKVRWNQGSPYVPHPNGLVSSFFPYGHDGSKSDEVDLEFVSKMVNDEVTYPDGDPILTNTWNESLQDPEYVAPPGLNLALWNTFRIYWCPSLRRVSWTWLDPTNGETLLRTETDALYTPDERMNLYFNFWAPCDTSWGHGCNPWDDAADPNLQPVSNPNKNEISAYEIDYVEVRAVSCEGLGGDTDCDGICDDGPGDFCTGGETMNCKDNCPYIHNPDQEDSGGVGAEGPDGIGTACQCGDVTGDGICNGTDATFITRQALDLLSPLFNVPGNCDVTGDGICNGTDATFITRKALGLFSPLFGNHCANYTGSCEVDASGNCL
jgi:hypothetical protein